MKTMVRYFSLVTPHFAPRAGARRKVILLDVNKLSRFITE
ncbi:hypothetical protein BN938_2589 [Mucinivorans hirudinis]|uniref:Uncharacterized protein n=1 Tax=Mucinivorans hirudinis TaxID=1433126 RepID=A0A060REG1_9BACT|nr:hypothetical protein BN938_2589 [Mucinivorans hirudinis]